LREILICSTAELRSAQRSLIVLLRDQVKRAGQVNPIDTSNGWACEILFKMYVEAIDEICGASGSRPPMKPSMRLTAEPSALVVEFRKRLQSLILAAPRLSLAKFLLSFSFSQNIDFLVEEHCIILSRTRAHQAVVSLLESKLRDHSAAEEYRRTFADKSTSKFCPIMLDLGGSLFDRFMPTNIVHEFEMLHRLASLPVVDSTEAAISPSFTAAAMNTHKQSRLRSLEMLRLLPDARLLTEVLSLLSEAVMRASDEVRAAATARSLALVSARQRKAGLTLQQAQCVVIKKDGVCAECGRRIASDQRGIIATVTSEFVFLRGKVLHPTCAKGVTA
jgi:Vacuolar sorting protein 39 domain 2